MMHQKIFSMFNLLCLTSCLTGLESAVQLTIFVFYLQNRLIQTSQTGGQWYSDTSPFSIPCMNLFLTCCCAISGASANPSLAVTRSRGHVMTVTRLVVLSGTVRRDDRSRRRRVE
jgi:hypothetical protein